jgi:purine-binding chemotaxis protein CheW
VREVQEVIRYQEMTRVPLAAPVVRGLINLRGQIVTAIDLRRRLGLPDRGDSGEHLPMNLVVRTDDGVVSLLVDEIGEVVEVDEDTFERPPPTLDGVARELVRGVYKREGSLLLVLGTGFPRAARRPGSRPRSWPAPPGSRACWRARRRT